MSYAHRVKAERIARIKGELKRVAEARVAETVSARARLEQERAALLATLNEGRFGPLLVDNVARRLGRLATDDAALARRQAAQEATALKEALGLKHAERHAETAARAHDAEAERAAVAEIAELSALRSARS